jgi:hypothetical protein
MHTLAAIIDTLGGATNDADNDNEADAWVLISETAIAMLLARAMMRGAEYRWTRMADGSGE